jgi:hypothetical protein
MGPRAGFDNDMRGGCTPFVGLTWLISESSYERIHHLLPMPARMGQFHEGCGTSACLSPARAPICGAPLPVPKFDSGFVLSFLGYYHRF